MTNHDPGPAGRNSDQWVVTLWRDWLTEDIIAKLDLNDRQKEVVNYLKIHGKISNKEYQQVANCIKKTAIRDLSNLKEKGLIEQIGSRGPGVHYVITKDRDKMGTLGTFHGTQRKDSQMPMQSIWRECFKRNRHHFIIGP